MGNIINRLRTTFAEPVLAGLLVVVGFAVLGWPFVDLVRPAGERALFLYFFLAWGTLVALGALLAWAARPAPGDDEHRDV